MTHDYMKGKDPHAVHLESLISTNFYNDRTILLVMKDSFLYADKIYFENKDYCDKWQITLPEIAGYLDAEKIKQGI